MDRQGRLLLAGVYLKLPDNMLFSNIMYHLHVYMEQNYYLVKCRVQEGF